MGGRVRGLRYSVAVPGTGGAEELDDLTLADKVRSELRLSHDLNININVEDGVVVLRGAPRDEDEIDDLVRRIGNVKGVRSVQSLIEVAQR